MPAAVSHRLLVLAPLDSLLVLAPITPHCQGMRAGLVSSPHGSCSSGSRAASKQETGKGLGWGMEDGPRPVLVPTAASQPTIPFKGHEFVHWPPSVGITQCSKLCIVSVLYLRRYISIFNFISLLIVLQISPNLSVFLYCCFKNLNTLRPWSGG